VDTPEFPKALLGRYLPQGLLGAGAMGAVYRARDQELGREVAVKVVTLDLDDAVRSRFEREAKVLAAVESPHVLRIYDVEVAGDTPYLITELLDGKVLGPGSNAAVMEQMLDAAAGLQAAHDAEVLHRDVKPSNVFRTTEQRVVLLDFGLAASQGSRDLTKTGAVVGTLLYLAPEIVTGGMASIASDWYAWGATLYELLERHPVSKGPDLASFLAGTDREIPFLRAGEESPIAFLLRACLDRDPNRRPRDLADIRVRLGLPDSGSASELELVRLSGGHPAVKRISSSSLSQSSFGPRPRPRPKSRSLAALVGGGVLLSAGLALGVREIMMRPVPPATVTPTATVEATAGPLFPVTPAQLSAEVAELMRLRYDDSGHPTTEPEGRPYDQVVLDRGLGTYLVHPVQEKVFRWLRQGGRPPLLPPEIRQALFAYDEVLVGAGLATTFEPFLAPPAAKPLVAIPPELLVKPWGPNGWDEIELPLRGWAAEAVRHAGSMVRFTLRHDEDLRERVARGERIPGGRVFVSQPGDTETLAELSLLGLEGRRQLHQRLAPGHHGMRSFLWTAFLALEDPELPAPVQTKLQWLSFLVLDRTPILLYPGWLTTHPDRLVGGRPTRAESAFLRATVTTEMQSRVRAAFLAAVVAPGMRQWVGPDEEISRWRVVLDAAAIPGTLDPALGARAFSQLIEVITDVGEPAALVDEYENRAARWLPACSDQQRKRIEARLAWARKRADR
jgi:serine/threonine protein kinase